MEVIISFIFKEYKKHLSTSDVDYEDTKAALELVLDAASHANEMMRKLVNLKFNRLSISIPAFLILNWSKQCIYWLSRVK